MKCWLCPRSSQKRESGESPERSGHCNRGANLHYPIVHSMRRGRQAMILKSGNLLCMARLNFRVKCNNQLGISAIPSVVCLRKQAFFYGVRLFVWIIPIRSVVAVTGCESLKRVWLNGRRYCFGCIRSLRIFERIHCLPRSSIANPL